MIALSRWKIVFAVGLVLAVSVGIDAVGLAQEKKPDAKSEEPALPKATPEQQKRIDQLIAQLGADDFKEREQAQKELEKIGLPALAALHKATKNSEAEIARRAKDLTVRMEDLLKTSKQLAPKMVNLKLKDVSVVDALAALTKQSGYPIQIDGDKTKLAEQKITLETGDVSFWEAYDQLCAKGSLVEVGNLHVTAGQPVKMPTTYAGALRVRVIPSSVKRKDGVVEFMLELALEPRFRQPRILSPAKIETALDEKGEPLVGLDNPNEKPSQMHVPAALKLGDKQKTLKELSGTVMFETIMADKMLAIDDVPKSAGKSVKNQDMETFRLDSYEKKANGDVTIRATLSKTMPRNQGGGIVIGGPNTAFRPELRDANGLPYQFVNAPGQSVSLSGTMLSITQTITYRALPGCGEPAELSLTSDKKTALTVPFSFKNLTLP